MRLGTIRAFLSYPVDSEREQKSTHSISDHPGGDGCVGALRICRLHLEVDNVGAGEGAGTLVMAECNRCKPLAIYGGAV